MKWVVRDLLLFRTCILVNFSMVGCLLGDFPLVTRRHILFICYGASSQCELCPEYRILSRRIRRKMYALWRWSSSIIERVYLRLYRTQEMNELLRVVFGVVRKRVLCHQDRKQWGTVDHSSAFCLAAWKTVLSRVLNNALWRERFSAVPPQQRIQI